MTTLEGEVKWFNNERGYGFIHPITDGNVVDESVEYFVHFTSIQAEGFKTLQAKQRVLFSLKETEKGMQAVDVKAIK
jgi:CspA family cold shock protein